MKKNVSILQRWLWVVFPANLLLLAAIGIWKVNVPLASTGYAEGKRLFHHYTKKNDASTYSEALTNLNKEVALLDSLLKQIENRKLQSGGALVDDLYAYADSAGFLTEKIEAGVPQQVAGHTETAISIAGTGSYMAVGAFMEKIENCPQSTRIRQLTIKLNENAIPEVFIDVAVREPNAGALKKEK
jgi:Tfp pilus assembly protein PilO